MNKLISGKASVLVLTAVFAVSAFLFGKSITKVLAVKPDKVVVCHSTGSNGNPYVSSQADKTADAGGHDGHNGGVYPADPWGDIIPPFTYSGGSYPGKNWTTAGIAIWQNGCNIPGSPTPSPTPSGSPDPSASPSPSPEPQFHSVCREFACVLVEGAGTNSCAVDNDCSPNESPSPTPLVCSGDQHLNAGGTECVSFSQPGAPTPPPAGQVLGASTMAAAGSFTENLYLAIMALGGTLTAFGLRFNKKASSKAN